MCVPVPYPAAPKKGLPWPFAFVCLIWSAVESFIPGKGLFTVSSTISLRHLLRRTGACLKLGVPGSNGDPNAFSLAPGQVMFGPRAHEMLAHEMFINHLYN